MTGSPAFRLERCGSSQGRGAVFIGEDALPAEIEYEKLRAEYRDKDASGIPMSVRERYERSLEELQGKLRGRRHARRLGEILVEMGVIDQEVLAKALGQQLAEGGRTLVGEVLVRHGWVDAPGDPESGGAAGRGADKRGENSVDSGEAGWE